MRPQRKRNCRQQKALEINTFNKQNHQKPDTNQTRIFGYFVSEMEWGKMWDWEREREKIKTKQNSAGNAVILGVVLYTWYLNRASDATTSNQKDNNKKRTILRLLYIDATVRINSIESQVFNNLNLFEIIRTHLIAA